MLVYTFRGFPAKTELEAAFGEVFVFHKLRDDLERFKALIEAQRPEIILGVALGKPSRLEPTAVNRFGKRATVVKNAARQLDLGLPPQLPPGFIVAPQPTHTFCNWTMYHLQSYVNAHHPGTKVMFAHLRPADIPALAVALRRP